ncbi:MAG: tRNA 4-thiouridine(8) synthase ThiI [Candidatus Omnitrophica bacterium]|nr:tRNA 4-thiouridine(8) synthase ThiI [Candidatus Omnitrophota bacterium]
MIKAIALISGGLDSILAAVCIKKQQVKVEGVFFNHPFLTRPNKKSSPENMARYLAEQQDIELKIINLGEEFLDIVFKPKFGYGKRMNPCIDCKILMLKKAKEIMEKEKASFLICGDVVAQRPMSQHRQTLKIIEKEANVEGILLRPLSAHLLEPTVAEEKGWIDRQKLYAFSGRSRTFQRDLAVMLNVLDYPNASGGCLLTDITFSRRLRDLINRQCYNSTNVELLKVGRHFRLSNLVKCVVGRNQLENLEIERLASTDDYLCYPEEDIPGPTALLQGQASYRDIELACSIVASYCDKIESTPTILVRKVSSGQIKKYEVIPLDREQLDTYRI